MGNGWYVARKVAVELLFLLLLLLVGIYGIQKYYDYHLSELRQTWEARLASFKPVVDPIQGEPCVAASVFAEYCDELNQEFDFGVRCRSLDEMASARRREIIHSLPDEVFWGQFLRGKRPVFGFRDHLKDSVRMLERAMDCAAMSFAPEEDDGSGTSTALLMKYLIDGCTVQLTHKEDSEEGMELLLSIARILPRVLAEDFHVSPDEKYAILKGFVGAINIAIDYGKIRSGDSYVLIDSLADCHDPMQYAILSTLSVDEFRGVLKSTAVNRLMIWAARTPLYSSYVRCTMIESFLELADIVEIDRFGEREVRLDAFEREERQPGGLEDQVGALAFRMNVIDRDWIIDCVFAAVRLKIQDYKIVHGHYPETLSDPTLFLPRQFDTNQFPVQRIEYLPLADFQGYQLNFAGGAVAYVDLEQLNKNRTRPVNR